VGLDSPFGPCVAARTRRPPKELSTLGAAFGVLGAIILGAFRLDPVSSLLFLLRGETSSSL